jgi:hypothetical protein
VPLRFERLKAVAGTLYSGDYSIAGLEASFAVERKSIDDLPIVAWPPTASGSSENCTGFAATSLSEGSNMADQNDEDVTVRDGPNGVTVDLEPATCKPDAMPSLSLNRRCANLESSNISASVPSSRS